MAGNIDLGELTGEPDTFAIGVLERNRGVLQRAARIVRSAARLDWVAAEDEPIELRAKLSETARLIACEELDVELVLSWMTQSMPQAKLIAWSHEPVARLIGVAARDDRLVSVLGWPSFQSMPRSWEIALATRRILWPDPEATSLAEVFAGVPLIAEFQPRTQDDRDAVVAEVAALAERIGTADRTSKRIGEVTHELVMNATYDAPVDDRGEPHYAQDRRRAVVLGDREVPIVQFATDGILAAVQVTDPFGRLSRDHVLASIQRGADAGRSHDAEVVDRTHGGAGIGLWRVYSSSAVTIVDIIPGHTTSITAVFDCDLAPREARTLPPSLHLFDRGRIG